MIAQIILLRPNHAAAVAQLHINGIPPTGFISSLGQEFVAALYEAIAVDKNSFGFVTFSINLSRLYKHVAIKKGFKFAFVLANRMLSLRVIKKVWDNLFYPSKMKKMDLPDAELLSIVIAPEGRGRGIAKQLVNAGLRNVKNGG